MLQRTFARIAQARHHQPSEVEQWRAAERIYRSTVHWLAQRSVEAEHSWERQAAEDQLPEAVRSQARAAAMIGATLRAERRRESRLRSAA